MLAILWKLLIGTFKTTPSCAHEWEDKRRIKVFGIGITGCKTEDPVAFEVECCCKKCGAWKAFKL